MQKKEIDFTKEVKESFEQNQNETTKSQTKTQNNPLSLLTLKDVECEEIGLYILNGLKDIYSALI